MQHAGWKTPEKAISVELLQDSEKKSLFNTLFMMFNSRYQGNTFHTVLPPTTQLRIGRMYYILKAWEPIKRFAVIRCDALSPGSKPDRGEEENPDKKDDDGWMKPTVSLMYHMKFKFCCACVLGD
jgi:hypothetical protein